MKHFFRDIFISAVLIILFKNFISDSFFSGGAAGVLYVLILNVLNQLEEENK